MKKLNIGFTFHHAHFSEKISIMPDYEKNIVKIQEGKETVHTISIDQLQNYIDCFEKIKSESEND